MCAQGQGSRSLSYRSLEMIIRKNRNELEQMRKSGMLVWQILQDLSKMVHEGVTTQDLEVAAEKMMKDAGAKPAFKGYYTPAAGSKYPFVLCTSVNDEIVHGMPSAKTKLKKGDIVSIDTGVQLNGYFGDSAITVPVGEINESAKRLLAVTKESLELAIEKVRAGQPAVRYLRNGGAARGGERIFGRPRDGGPRHRDEAARGAAGAQLRGPAERESAVEGRHGAGDRADGECRRARICGCCPTSGRR